jgi:hypothetical protein
MAMDASIVAEPRPGYHVPQMNFFDAGDHATGFIAVGQHATGFFAFGQMATGVIAIGQVARGGIAIGQLAVGLVGWGQAGVGIFYAAGMVGIGGRKGLGIVLPIIPSIGRPRVLPEATPYPAIEAGGSGWLDVDLAHQGGVLGLYQNGQRLPIKLDRRLPRRAHEITAEGPRRVRAYTTRVGAVIVCDRIAHEPPRPYQKKSFKVIASAQLAALFVMGIVYAAAAGHDVAVFLGDLTGITDDSPPPAKKRPPVKHRRR